MKATIVLCSLLTVLAACSVPGPGADGALSGKEILSFAIREPGTEGLVDQSARSIRVELPSGTAISALVAEFKTTGQTVTVNDVPQESGVTVNDFTGPLEYVVLARDGTTATYVVTVSCVQPPSSEKAITSFSFLSPPVAGLIDEPGHAIRLTVPHGTDVTSLAAVFTSTGLSVSVNDTEQESGVTVNDFGEPLAYLVHAQDGSTASYTVTVTVAPGGEKAITDFSVTISGAASAIDQEARIIRVRVPEGTDQSSLVAVFTSTGASVSVDGLAQESGLTPNDFRAPVRYTVMAEDGSTAVYEVRVVGAIALLINELDVDQPGTDTAEYVELTARSTVDLGGLVLVLVNGSVTPGQEYARVDLGPAGELDAGTYLVVAGPRVAPREGSTRLSPPGWDLSNRIQNGPSDAVVLYDLIGHRVVDAVCYNGTLSRAVLSGEAAEVAPMEGAAGAPPDSGTVQGSIGRAPDGRDTNQNAADFVFSPTLTPGGPNP